MAASKVEEPSSHAEATRAQLLAESARHFLSGPHQCDRYTEMQVQRLVQADTAIARPQPTWSAAALTPMQQHARAQQEAVLRNDAARGLPTCFGDLS